MSGRDAADGWTELLQRDTILAPKANMGWIACGIAWLAAALFWSLASASSSGMSPADTLPFGLLGMGTAALMGVAVWRATGRFAWDRRTARFYAWHGLALILYSIVYATSWIWPDIAAGRFRFVWTELRTSPVLLWNLLMGSWLYLIVVGISYAIRAQRRLVVEAAAASEARLLAQQAQLAALRAQVNPHFLFNALHSVGALVVSDPVRADRALEQLGDLLRYALGSDDEVLFAEEWRFTLDYLAFEQLRLGERLSVTTDATPATMSLLVPPLILQPIVENAIRHGIADRVDGGSIDVRAQIAEGRCVVRVSDDGGGPSSELREGIGMGTVRRRLAALYQDAATLVTRQVATSFVVEIALPATAGRGGDEDE